MNIIHTDQATRDALYQVCRQRVADNQAIIIATSEALDHGTKVLIGPGNQPSFAIYARATREEYLNQGGINTQERAPFYYEIRLEKRK